MKNQVIYYNVVKNKLEELRQNLFKLIIFNNLSLSIILQHFMMRKYKQ